MSAWKDLPNSKHIDWVLKSLKTHRQLWRDTYNQAYDQAWRQAYNQARYQAYSQVREQDRDQAYNQAFNQARGQAWDQAWGQAWDQALGSCLALVAYDDSSKYLSMTSDQLKVWIELSEDSVAILLLPMVQVKEKLNQLTSVV